MAIRFLTSQNIQAGTLTVSTIANLATASNVFLVSDGGLVKYRTAAQVRSDIGAGTGTVTSVAVTNGTGISASVANATTTPNITITNTDLGSSQNIFKNIAVSGESTIVADSNNDTLTFVSGSNIAVTTNATTDTITISASDTNNYPTSLSWNTGTGILTLGRSSLSNLTVDLDGRYLELSGGTLTGGLYGTFASFGGILNSYVTIDNLARRFNSPEGATYITQTSSVTGAIKIKLPVARNNSATMMMFTVKIYQYSTGNCHELQIAGYNYNLGNWYNTSVTNLTDNGGNLNVRFGTDATSDCVWIGETSSNWSYPQVFVTDFQAGYSGQANSWGEAWNITFETAFDTVEDTRTASQVITSRSIGAQSVNYAVSAGTAGALSSMNISQFTNDSGYITSAAVNANYASKFTTLTINGVGYDLSANRSWSVGTVTSFSFGLGTTGTDLNATLTNNTTTPALTLNVPDASATARGVITTGTQTIAGAKTFSSTVTGSGFTFGASQLYNYSASAIFQTTTGNTISFGGGPGSVQNNVTVANGTFNIALQTASTIASFDASKNVVSLPTATYPSLTELAYVKGVTSAIQTQLNAKGTVNSITAGTGLSGGTITSSGTIALANTAVTAGSYTAANITVDAQGRITAAANGSGGGGITGSGTTNYIPKFTGATSVGDSIIYTNGTSVGVNTTTPTSRFTSVTNASGPVSFDNRAAVYGHNTSTEVTFNNPIGVAGRVVSSGGMAIYGDATTGSGWAGYFNGKGYFSANVGIATTTPQYPLDVNGTTILRSGLYMSLGGTSSTPDWYFQINGSGDLVLDDVGTRNFIFSNTGQVLIGTTVAGTPTYGSAPQFVTASTTGGVIDIRSLNTTIVADSLLGRIQFTGQDDTTVGYTSAAIEAVSAGAPSSGSNGGGTLKFMTSTTGYGTNPVTRMWISYLGYVTIGSTNSNSYPLRILTQVGNISIYADYDIVAFSDQSVKENIRPIENVIERVQKSRGVLYDRIDSGSKDNIGFIAQELEVAFPELVITNEDGTKAVKYQNAVAVMFEAIKEQQKQIDDLKELVTKLIK